MDAVDTGRIGRAASSVTWLFGLYALLLYVAVGVLGTAELTRRYGDESANIIHLVGVVKDLRTQESHAISEAVKALDGKTSSLEAAISELRTFGIAHGLSLQDIQPIIDTHELAPKLSKLTGQTFPFEVESQWAEHMARVMALQIDIARDRDALDKRRDRLRANWSGTPQVVSEASRMNLTPVEIDVAAATADTLQRLGYGVLFALPAEILTMVLALSMGALGSTLQITRIAMDPAQSQQASFYLVRPFQGMVTALVVFILLKAGQLTISEANTDSLNTYFVAFTGIASGLLAEEAYQMIRKAGAGVIKTDDPEARWAFRLKEAMQAGNVSPADLAEGIGVTDSEVSGWIEETQPVSALNQKLIAAWLHASERDLFTAQPPKGAEGGAGQT